MLVINDSNSQLKSKERRTSSISTKKDGTTTSASKKDYITPMKPRGDKVAISSISHSKATTDPFTGLRPSARKQQYNNKKWMVAYD